MKFSLILLVLTILVIGIVSAGVLPKRVAEPDTYTLEEMIKRHKEDGDDDGVKGGGGRGGRGGRGGSTPTTSARGRGGNRGGSVALPTTITPRGARRGGKS
jgi:hypothetical protein